MIAHDGHESGHQPVGHGSCHYFTTVTPARASVVLHAPKQPRSLPLPDLAGLKMPVHESSGGGLAGACGRRAARRRRSGVVRHRHARLLAAAPGRWRLRARRFRLTARCRRPRRCRAIWLNRCARLFSGRLYHGAEV